MKKLTSLIHLKRRRKKKTNYKKRLALLKSEKARLVIRKSLSNISVQLINFEKKQRIKKLKKLF